MSRREQIEVRVSDQEREVLRATANHLGVPLSTMVRRVMLEWCARPTGERVLPPEVTRGRRGRKRPELIAAEVDVERLRARLASGP